MWSFGRKKLEDGECLNKNCGSFAQFLYLAKALDTAP